MRQRRYVTALVVAVLLAGTAHASADPDPDPGEFEWRTDEHLVYGKPEFGNENSPLRPGADLGPRGFCSFNYVFYDPTKEGDPPVYIGTAGHCTERVGQRVTLGASQEIGTVVYDSDVAPSSDVDFSLVKIDRSMVAHTNPKVIGWGGPRGIVGASGLNQLDQVDVHGNGMVLGDNSATRSRWGLLIGWTRDTYAADIPAVNGDSGAPLIHDRTRKALGIISHYGTRGVPPTTDAGPTMAWIFREISDAGFNDLVLATAQ